MKSLSHHGIKGQQWGVKHGPPYPIQKDNGVTLRMGTKISRLSIYDESVSKGHAYVNYNNYDKEHYKGFFASRLKAVNKGAKVYSIEFTAKQDLRSPNYCTRMQTFKDLYKNDPEIRKELAKYYKSNHIKFAPDFIYERKFKNLNDKQLEKFGYDTFVRSIGDKKRKTREKYFAELVKQGYSFVMDDMDGQHMLKYGLEPAIIFDRDASLKYQGQSEVSVREMMKNFKKYGLKAKTT